MRQQFVMLIPTELTISNNRTAQVWKRKKVKDGIRALTREAAKDRYPVGKASIYVGIEKRTKGAYDPVNLSDTFKACVDELVNMGILAEADYPHERGPFRWHKGADSASPRNTSARPSHSPTTQPPRSKEDKP